MPKAPEALIRDEIQALTAYRVQDARGMVKLDAMENPYGLPDALASAAADRVKRSAFNRYPDPSAVELKEALRSAMDIPAGAPMLLGNGSDELIQMLALALAKPGATMLSVQPSFVMFRMIASFAGMRYVGVPLAPDFSIDGPATLAAIAQHQPALIFIAYPNNPTGNLF